MSFSKKRLMKWREPKIKGFITPKNVLTIFILVLLLSIPFGFIESPGTYKFSNSLLALGFMSAGLLGFFLTPLLPGTRVELTDEGIVRKTRRRQKSLYRDIDSIHFFRNCSHEWIQGQLTIDAYN